MSMLNKLLKSAKGGMRKTAKKAPQKIEETFVSQEEKENHIRKREENIKKHEEKLKRQEEYILNSRAKLEEKKLSLYNLQRKSSPEEKITKEIKEAPIQKDEPLRNSVRNKEEEKKRDEEKIEYLN